MNSLIVKVYGLEFSLTSIRIDYMNQPKCIDACLSENDLWISVVSFVMQCLIVNTESVLYHFLMIAHKLLELNRQENHEWKRDIKDQLTGDIEIWLRKVIDTSEYKLMRSVQ